jgi:hypothetical protein
VKSPSDALALAFDLGVREGIRRATQEVRMIPCWKAPDGTSDFDLPGDHPRMVVLETLDALGATP